MVPDKSVGAYTMKPEMILVCNETETHLDLPEHQRIPVVVHWNLG